MPCSGKACQKEHGLSMQFMHLAFVPYICWMAAHACIRDTLFLLMAQVLVVSSSTMDAR